MLANRRRPDRLTSERELPAAALRAQAVEAARGARRQLFLLVPLLGAIVTSYSWRRELFGLDVPVRIATAIALVAIGWGIARGLGRIAEPAITRRIGAPAAGIGGWIVRLIALVFTALISMRLAGLQLGTLALGASFTAVVVGLAAQQTVGNVLAGLVLISARPFTIGDRVRFAGFGMDVEGTVAAYGLLYVTMHDGQDPVLIPNTTALTMSVRPIREPSAVDLRARLPLGTDPEAVEHRVAAAIDVPTRGAPHIVLEEMDAATIVVRIRATPEHPPQGARLAGQVMEAVTGLRDPTPIAA